MSFANEIKPVGEVLLFELEFEQRDDAGGLVKPAVAIFTDGSTIKFPPGCKFGLERHVGDPGNPDRASLRMRVIPTKDDEGRPVQPTFFIPQFCSPDYVRTAIERILKKV